MPTTGTAAFTLDASAFICALDIAGDAALDLLVAVLDDDLHAAAAQVREIRTLADFDARTAQIAAEVEAQLAPAGQATTHNHEENR